MIELLDALDDARVSLLRGRATRQEEVVVFSIGGVTAALPVPDANVLVSRLDEVLGTLWTLVGSDAASGPLPPHARTHII